MSRWTGSAPRSTRPSPQRSCPLSDHMLLRGCDPRAILDYPSARTNRQRLLLGTDARVRSGTVLYSGSRIGARFQTGHNVVIREECAIGADVSVGRNSAVDSGARIGA